jgi:DNA-binding response OmpR family regulator
VCRPEGFRHERLLLGELHLVRTRLDATLAEIAGLISMGGGDGWLRVEEAARLARRALVAAAGAVPPLGSVAPESGEVCVGALRIDTLTGRQWYGEVEFELTPLRHRVLATMAADPYRVFAKDELLREVWRRPELARSNAVNTTVSRIRRALVRAGAPADGFMLSLHGVGWALTRPD